MQKYCCLVILFAILSELRAETLEERFTILERAFQNYVEQTNTKIKNLETRIEKKNKECFRLENRVKILESKLDDTNDRFDNPDITNTKNQNENVSVSNGYKSQSMIRRDKSVDMILNHTNRVFQRSISQVAFHAVQSSSHTYSAHEIIKFDDVRVNVGSGFGASDYIFDAPVTGLYVFALMAVPEFYEYFQMELVISGSVKGLNFADSDEIHDIHPATAIVLVNVIEGQHVYVRRGSHSNSGLRSDTGQAKPTFSGWLLF